MASKMLSRNAHLAGERGSNLRLTFQNELVSELLAQTAEVAPADEPSPTQSDGALRHCFRAQLAAGVASLKFGGLCQEWQAEFIPQDDRTFAIRVPLRGTFFQRLRGQPPSLLVNFNVQHTDPDPKAPAVVQVEIKPCGCTAERGRQLVSELGSLLLASVRSYLHSQPERRTNERRPYDQPLQFFPIFPSVRPEEAVEGVSRDISAHGMRFWSRVKPSSTHLCINLCTPSLRGSIRVLARVVRVTPDEHGGYEIGVLFPNEMC
jgi:PilZ domain